MSLTCGKAPCPEHGELCAYHGDEVGRCPWCHTAWHVINNKQGWHSCEKPTVWPFDERGWRTRTAKQMASLAVFANLFTAPHCPHTTDSPPEAPKARKTTKNPVSATRKSTTW